MHLFFTGAYSYHPSPGRLSLHQPPAFGNELEPVFETKDPGHAGGNVFTDTMTQQKVRLQTPRRPELVQGIFRATLPLRIVRSSKPFSCS
jgi:hypothetical protein